MPIFDLPPEKLIEYQGRNPRPADHDAYWARALAALDATDPAVTLTPSGFRAPHIRCYDLWYTGVGGAKIHAKFLRPETVNGKIPAVLHFHGYTLSASDWTFYLSFAYAGFAVFAMDARGQGGLSEDVGGVTGTTCHGDIVRGLADPDPDHLLFRNIFLDAAELARIACDMDFIDETRIFAFGASQGGALTLACAALEPRVAKIAFACPFLCDFRRVWEMDLTKKAYDDLTYFFRQFDPRHEKEEEYFEKLGYIDLQFLTPRIRARAVMYTGLMDTTCPPSAQFAAYNRMTCEKRSVLYPDYRHESYPGMNDEIFRFFCET